LFGSALAVYFAGAILYVDGWIIASAVFALVFLAWASKAPRGASIALAVWVVPAIVANLASGNGRLIVIALVDLAVFVLALASLPSAAVVDREKARRRQAMRDGERSGW